MIFQHTKQYGKTREKHRNRQPEKTSQGLSCCTPSMSPILAQKIGQHCQRLLAQPKIRPGVLQVKEAVQDTQVNPAVQGSCLVKEKKENNKNIFSIKVSLRLF